MTKTLKFFSALSFFIFVFFYQLGFKVSPAVIAGDNQCKHQYSECDVNNSFKRCCPGLVCTDHGVPSNNGKCELPHPTSTPTRAPTSTPTRRPTATPTRNDENCEHHHNCHNSPTPTKIPTSIPTSVPTVTDVPTATPTQTDEITSIPTPTVITTISPTVAPTSSPNVGGGDQPSSNNNSAPVCNDQDPGAPTNLSLVALGGGKVRLSWDNSPGPHTSYAVAYGPSIGNYLYGDPNVGNVTSYVVSALNPGGKYCFYVQAQNGCKGGVPSNVVCTNEPQTRGSASVLGASDNFNPLVEGIKESYGGSVLGESTELMATAEVSYSADKLPSGNVITENKVISIPSLNINQPIYTPQRIGDDLTVGHHEVLETSILGIPVYYGHNATDVFGKLFKIETGAVIKLYDNNKVVNYKVVAKEFVHKSNVESVSSNSSESIVLVTCSYTQPDYRIVIKASILK